MAITNDVIQNLSDRTAIASVRMNYSASNSGATYAGTSNWIDLGAMDPASPSFNFNKSVTDVMTGSPMTIKQRHITQWDGTMGGEIVEYNDNALNATIGTTIGITINAPTGYVATTVATGTHTTTSFDITDDADLVVGDRIAVTLGSGAFTWKEIKKIKTITPGVSPVAEIEIDGTFSEAPIAGAAVTKVERVDTVMGGNLLKEYQMRVQASFNDGTSMVLHAPKGNFTAAASPNFGDGQSVVKLPVEFGIIGTSSTVSGFSDRQVTLATHYAFYPASA